MAGQCKVFRLRCEIGDAVDLREIRLYRWLRPKLDLERGESGLQVPDAENDGLFEFVVCIDRRAR